MKKNSINQSQSELWKKERSIRLTSSNFGKVISRSNTNVSTALVNNMLYSKFSGNIHTIRGLAQEDNTIIEYKNVQGNVELQRTGLQISKEHPF